MKLPQLGTPLHAGTQYSIDLRDIQFIGKGGNRDINIYLRHNSHPLVIQTTNETDRDRQYDEMRNAWIAYTNNHISE